MRDSCSSRESHKSSRSSQEEQPPSQVSLVIGDGRGRLFFTGHGGGEGHYNELGHRDSLEERTWLLVRDFPAVLRYKSNDGIEGHASKHFTWHTFVRQTRFKKSSSRTALPRQSQKQCVALFR